MRRTTNFILCVVMFFALMYGAGESIDGTKNNVLIGGVTIIICLLVMLCVNIKYLNEKYQNNENI